MNRAKCFYLLDKRPDAFNDLKNYIGKKKINIKIDF